MEGTNVRLLYDGHFEEEICSLLVKKPLNHFNKKIVAQDEKCYRGCESDEVVYIGSGHLEAFSRAKLELGILLCCNLSSFKDGYNDADDKILSELAQWTHKPRLFAVKTKEIDTNVQDCWTRAMALIEAERIQAAWLALKGHLTVKTVSPILTK